MLNQQIFELNPAHASIQSIHMYIDTSFVHDKKQHEDLMKQLHAIESFLFDSQYAKHVHIQFYYRDGFSLRTISNQKDKTLDPLIHAKGLPYLSESIEAISRVIQDELDTISTKPWFFWFVHGFSIENQPMPSFTTLLKDSVIFSRGFLINNTIKRDRLHDIQPKPGFLVVSDDHVFDALSFIFSQAKKRIETPLNQGIDMPTKEYFATWSAPLTK